MESLFGERPRPQVGKIFSSEPLNQKVRNHLSRVYSCLVVTFFAAAIGTYVDVKFHVGGILTTVALFATLLYLVIDSDKSNLNKRVGILIGFGFLKGVSLGSLIEIAIEVNPGLIATALLGTTAVFAAFTLSALVAKKRSYLSMGGTLGSAISALVMISFLNIFLGSSFLFTLQLYVGLVVFSCYVLYDTPEQGDDDVVGHALELFIDFVAIFVRILIILMKNEEGDKKKKRGGNR